MELSQLIKDYKNKIPTKDLQIKYNLSWKKLTDILKKENVYKKHNSLIISNIKLDYIKKNYMLFSNNQIAKHLNINENWLREIAKKLNLPVKGSGWKRNIHIENLDYSTNEFQYFLGWIAADGSISKNLHNISLSITDKEISERFLKVFPTASIYHKKYGYKKDQYIFHLCSKKLAIYLGTLGLIPNKTKKLHITSSLWNSHFVRGFFEGDGHVRKTKENSKYVRYSIGFVCASEKFIYSLKKYLDSKNINSKVKKENTYFRLNIEGKIMVNKFYKLIYKNCGIWYLNRKKQILDQLFSNE